MPTTLSGYSAPNDLTMGYNFSQMICLIFGVSCGSVAAIRTLSFLISSSDGTVKGGGIIDALGTVGVEAFHIDVTGDAAGTGLVPLDRGAGGPDDLALEGADLEGGAGALGFAGGGVRFLSGGGVLFLGLSNDAP